MSPISAKLPPLFMCRCYLCIQRTIPFYVVFKWFCPKCEESDEDSEDDSDNDSDEDSDEGSDEDSDEDSDEKSGKNGKGQNKKASTRSRNRFQRLFDILTPEQHDAVEKSLIRAGKFKESRKKIRMTAGV